MESTAIYGEIVRYVDEHIGEDVTIDSLVKSMGYSRRHLYKIFQTHSEIPIMEYIRRRKLSAAAGALHSDRTMLDIALDYGYETHSGFYKAFQAIYGCSPSDYRNNMIRSNEFINET